MRAMHLDEIEAEALSALGGFDEASFDAVELAQAQRMRFSRLPP